MTEQARLLAVDTIAAIATPPGRGGIGIVRLSGPASVACAQTLMGPLALVPGQARFCHLTEPLTARRLDEALVTFFAAPRSYTGEDVVEIAAHGSPVLLEHVLRTMIAAGARLARPGEFTERAFLSGRLDLTQAEAVRDLIDAQTLEQAQTAAMQLGGAVSRQVAPVKTALIALIAQLEAGIDFAEDDTPVLSDVALAAALAQVAEPLQELERSFARGRLLREGVRLAIVGRPNAGKSSMFNRLLGRNRAIVTSEPGTTRDTVEERLDLRGIPVELIDTAGLREAAGEAERIGIEKSREALADAGLVLLVVDGTNGLQLEDREILEAAQNRRLIVAWNKNDQAAAPLIEPPPCPVIPTSALTGDGMEALQTAMLQAIGGAEASAPEAAMLTNLRQHTAVAAALAAVANAQGVLQYSTPHEMLLLDLYAALAELDTLTGTTTPDDILNLIFSTFCIGK